MTWTGLANSYNHEGYTNINVVKFDFVECCKQVRPTAAQDAQKAWNVESERFQQAVEQQTSISASYVPSGPVSGTVTRSDAESRQYDVNYADRRWTVTADCDCIQDGFISTDAGCNSQTAVDAVVDAGGDLVETILIDPVQSVVGFLGRKLMQVNDCGNAGRKRDSCSVKVQCTYKAVTASSCEYSNNLGNNGFNNGFDNGFDNGGGFNGGGFNNAGNGNPDFATPYGACACTDQCGPKQATPGFCYNGGQGSCRVGSACQGKNLRPYQGWMGTSYYRCC